MKKKHETPAAAAAVNESVDAPDPDTMVIDGDPDSPVVIDSGDSIPAVLQQAGARLPNAIEAGLRERIAELEDKLAKLHASIETNEHVLAARREAENWQKRYANARRRVEAFNKLAVVLQGLAFIPPADLRV